MTPVSRPRPAPDRAGSGLLRAVATSPVRAMLLAVLLVMVLAQWAGLLHAVAHGGAAPAKSVATALHTNAPAMVADGAQGDRSWGHAAGDADCQLWDHLLSQQAPSAAMADGKTPAPLAQAIVVADATAHRHGPVAFYAARAPPIT